MYVSALSSKTAAKRPRKPGKKRLQIAEFGSIFDKGTRGILHFDQS
jgi:hypothetical protein